MSHNCARLRRGKAGRAKGGPGQRRAGRKGRRAKAVPGQGGAGPGRCRAKAGRARAGRARAGRARAGRARAAQGQGGAGPKAGRRPRMRQGKREPPPIYLTTGLTPPESAPSLGEIMPFRRLGLRSPASRPRRSPGHPAESWFRSRTPVGPSARGEPAPGRSSRRCGPAGRPRAACSSRAPRP
jgi:hypothetical protein